LYQLEMMYSRTLETWNRSKAKKTASKISFRPSYLLPPEELPIQGLMMPEPPKHKEEREEQKKKTAFNPKRRHARNVSMRGQSKLVGNREKALKTESKAIRSFLCRCCDFRDKLTCKCLVLRLGGECPYMNGIYFHMSKKTMKIPVHTR